MKNKKSIFLKNFIFFLSLFLFLFTMFKQKNVNWCKISIKKTKKGNHAVPINISYNKIKTKTKLIINYHWFNKKKRLLKITSINEPFPKIINSGKIKKNLIIKNYKDTNFFKIVIYCSLSGKWQERTIAASTEFIQINKIKNLKKNIKKILCQKIRPILLKI